MDKMLAQRVVRFFTGLQRNPERAARLGHTFFMGLRTESDLRRRWRVQLSHVLRKAFRLNPDGFRLVEEAWNQVFQGAAPEPNVDATEVREAAADLAESPEAEQPSDGQDQPPSQS